MSVADVQREYGACMRRLRRQEDPKAIFLGTSDGKPVTVYAIRHYCQCLAVLFRRIHELEKAKGRLL